MNSVIIPCLWVNQSLIDMTFKCVSTMGDVGQVLIVADKQGYATNVNVGLAQARGDVLIVCNNDIEFIQPSWLEHLLKPLKNGYDVSTIRSTDCDGWETEDKITDKAKFGCLWAMKREVYEKVGPLDERFGKGLFEDLDYWHRVQDAGFKIGKNHAGLVQHEGKATFKEVDPNDDQFMINMFKYKEKWEDKAYIVEVEPNKILLIDDYELNEKTRPGVIEDSVSLDEAYRRWENVPRGN